MKFVQFVLLLAVAMAVVNSATDFVCTADFCDDVDCSSSPKSQDDCCPPTVYKANSSTCGCCGMCITELGEGASCSPLQIRGGPPPSTECRSPLTCVDGTCQLA